MKGLSSKALGIRFIERIKLIKNIKPKKTTHLVSHKIHFVSILDRGILINAKISEVGIQMINAKSRIIFTMTFIFIESEGLLKNKIKPIVKIKMEKIKMTIN